MKKTKFKKRYVLGTGYPWAIGTHDYETMGLVEERVGVKYVTLDRKAHV